MSWDQTGNLYCNCCYKIVIPKNKVTKRDRKENIGKTFCKNCLDKYGKLLERTAEKYYEEEKRKHGLQGTLSKRTFK